MDLSLSFPKNLYHSYVVEGEPGVLAYELIKFLEERGDIKSKSPDVLCQVYESFTIDDSREIKEWNSRMGISGGKKICVIATSFINREAEQALLKILEEPSENTHIFIIMPNISLLIDTIISRTQVVKLGQNISKEKRNLAIKFIKSNPKGRLEIISQIIKENKDEDNSSVLRGYVVSFINEVEKVLYEEWKKNRMNRKLQLSLKEIEKNRDFLNIPGSSVKMILEHLALVI